MTNTSTAVNDAVRAIVAIMRARTGFRSCWNTTATGVPVYHSAEAGFIDDHPDTGLIIADPGDPQNPDEAGQDRQRMATLGTVHARNEEATIHCRAWAHTGDAHDGAVQSMWDAAVAIVDAVDAELRDDPALGLTPPYSLIMATFDAVTGVRPYVGEGVVVEVLFDIAVDARI